MSTLLERTRQPASRSPQPAIDDIAAKVFSGERLTFDDGLRLMQHPNLAELGMLADYVRQRRHPGRVVTYICGRNINYTNVCWVQCKFCAFYDTPKSGQGYTLPKEEIFRKIQEMVDVGGVELLMQGGLNPKLKIEYYEDLFSSIKERFPTVWLHALSVAEILYIAKISRLSLEETLQRLRAAGHDTIPGAGAEMLVDRVRRFIAPYKDTSDEWIDTMKAWHRLGGWSSATMMYGTVETVEERLQHILKIRDAQDESLANTSGGFTAFIAWNFQPDGTDLAKELTPEWRKSSGFDYLRTIATARLLLDNVPHHQASWVTQGPKIAQIGLNFGLDDFGSTMMEENVVSAAGTDFVMPIAEIERLIRTAGYEPRRRNTLYA
ncbi:MAG TPA: cyclic dehypoxanthinyl futalosine synthase [Abditibacteriaceae bacterium]|nr:cyclic dehypoxanthinyl futalosine synthase [Abditibacteriaceae bacterium]